MCVSQSEWNWPAVLANPFWYFSKGLVIKGLLLLLLVIIDLWISNPSHMYLLWDERELRFV